MIKGQQKKKSIIYVGFDKYSIFLQMIDFNLSI